MLTKNQIIVRQGRENDSALIYRLILELAKDQNQTEYLETNESEIKKAISRQQSKMGVLVAELNTQIVGYLSFTWNYSIWNAK